MRRGEEIRKAARDYAMNKSNDNNTWFVDYKDIEEAFLEGAYFAFAYSANAEHNLESIWHYSSEEPKEHSKIVIIDTKGEWWNIDYDSDDIDGCGLYGWEFCIAYFNLKIWAYTDDLLPKGGEI